MVDNIYICEDLKYSKLEGYSAIKNSWITFFFILTLSIMLVSFGVFVHSCKVLKEHQDLTVASKEISKEYDILKNNLHDCEQSKITVYEDNNH